ncbi:MAG: DUF1549 domain-containing protein [Planctomycetales bacterium]|nr:DUF1549 domain-containing protein [Planctomycetales bacterium]
MSTQCNCLTISILLVALASFAPADESNVFEQHVRPIFATNCVKCHGPKKQEGELRLDSREAMLEGGESGPAIVPGEPAESLVVSAIHYDGLEMPPNKQLSAKQIESVQAWIAAGAVWPDNGGLIRDVSQGITDEDRQWWAFVPRKDVAPPAVDNDTWSQNSIDRFILEKLRQQDFEPAAAASRATLARRLYLDVIGLPPTPEQVQEFVEDDRADAYERLVDRLLDDERHGEHWARFWLDLVRYAESDGWKADAYRPNIWRYRDYVISAFNNDKPYPDFVREQLAGDEFDKPTPDQLVAAGYLRLGIFEYNQRNALKHWDDIINEVTDVTGDVFLGIGVSCARCHDHKFDPVLQADYFRMRAYFEPLIWRDDVPYATESEVADHSEKLAEWKSVTRDVRQEIESLLSPYNERKMRATVDKFSLEIQDHYRTPETERTSLNAQMAYLVKRQFYEEGTSPIASMKGDAKKEYERLTERLAEFDAKKPADLPTMLTVCNHTGTCSPTVIPDVGEVVEPGTLSVLAHLAGENSASVDSQETKRRRTALADWICDNDNPLTTRVIVNRIWKQHFGVGLVPTSSDFGRLGQPPTHGDLLDWLTNDFVNNGWRFKRLHKQILMSATWQQAAMNDYATEYKKTDPSVSFLWQRGTRRLSAEQIRDASLFVSGELQQTVGGKSVGPDAPRRAIYVKSFRNAPDPFLSGFDITAGLRSVADRGVTTTPTQALMMMNGKFELQCAKAFATRCQKKHDRINDQIEYATRLAWGRSPTESELAFAVDYVGEDSADRFVDFCHVLLNSSEFLYVD